MLLKVVREVVLIWIGVSLYPVDPEAVEGMVRNVSFLGCGWSGMERLREELRERGVQYGVSSSGVLGGHMHRDSDVSYTGYENK